VAPANDIEVGSPPDYSFAKSPKWMLSHLLVAALIAAMVFAGLWQVNRHQSRAERNDRIAERALEAPTQLASIAVPGNDFSLGEEEQFRRVTVTGEYRFEDEVLIRNRTFEGAPGWWVLTPLVTEDGWAVAVNRGWIPLSFSADEARPGVELPPGMVTVQGTIQPTRTAQGFQVSDPATGKLTSLARPDLERFAQQLGYDLAPVVLQIEEPDGLELTALPRPLTLPALDSGPHASYAVQWFIWLGRTR